MGEEIEGNSVGEYTLQMSNGEQIEADFVLKCTGLVPNSDAYKSSLGDAMDDRGALQVNQYLQVQGYNDIFAIGDCNNVDEPKMAVLAEHQGSHAIKQFSNIVHGKGLSPYKPNNVPWVVIVSLGRNHGVGQLKNGFFIPEFLLKKLKCADLFVGKFYKEFGYSPQ